MLGTCRTDLAGEKQQTSLDSEANRFPPQTYGDKTNSSVNMESFRPSSTSPRGARASRSCTGSRVGRLGRGRPGTRRDTLWPGGSTADRAGARRAAARWSSGRSSGTGSRRRACRRTCPRRRWSSGRRAPWRSRCTCRTPPPSAPSTCTAGRTSSRREAPVGECTPGTGSARSSRTCWSVCRDFGRPRCPARPSPRRAPRSGVSTPRNSAPRVWAGSWWCGPRTPGRRWASGPRKCSHRWSWCYPGSSRHRRSAARRPPRRRWRCACSRAALAGCGDY